MGEKKVALVTGGTGFVGSNLIHRLVAVGWEVHAIVRPDSGLKVLDACIDKISLHTHDGSTEGLVNILLAAKPEVVFHLASLFLSAHTAKDVVPLITSNVLFPSQLLEAMKESGVTSLVNTGTSWQHYENKDYSPVNLYAATKQSFEAILQYYVEVASLKAITLKLFDTYGPDDPRPKLFHLLGKAAELQSALAMSPGEQLLDLVYIDDVIDAYLLAADHVQSKDYAEYRLFAVSPRSPVKLKNLVQIYSEVTGENIEHWMGRTGVQRT
jgi:nucleoside-diphosphate-sugar epimerase